MKGSRTAFISNTRCTQEELSEFKRLLSTLGMKQSDWLLSTMKHQLRLLDEVGAAASSGNVIMDTPPIVRIQTALALISQYARDNKAANPHETIMVIVYALTGQSWETFAAD
ncbi:MAG: hypothetical protein GY796_22980 [Chloroflexi bacterium]|nr:hypothetical protein [Chloroflexota bacterium]